MQYYRQNRIHAAQQCFVRDEVAKMLDIAVTYLEPNHKLKIYDAWRPLALQDELYESYKKDIIAHFQLGSKSEKEQEMFVNAFIPKPIANTNFPPAHTTGGAVDVTIVDGNGNELDMGTQFDDFSQNAHTDAFENSTNEIVKHNRRMLYNAMIQAGFTNLPSEWWHYDYGNRNWAFVKQKPALYQGVFTRD